MTLRTKLLLVYGACAVVPMFALCLICYVCGMHAFEGVMREDEQRDLARLERGVETALAAHEEALAALSKEPALGPYLRGAVASGGRAGGAGAAVPEGVRQSLARFYAERRTQLADLTCFDVRGGPVLRLEEGGDGVRFQSEDFVTSRLRYDERVRQASSGVVLRSPLVPEPYGTGLWLTVPVFEAAGDAAPAGALAAQLNLDAVFKDATGGEADEPAAAGGDAAPGAARNLVALDNETGRILFHSNGAVIHQAVGGAMPGFERVAARMQSGGDGVEAYDAPNGDRWLATYGQLRGLNVSLAVMQNYSAAAAGVRRVALSTLALALVASATGLVLLYVIVTRASRRVERVAAAAAAIACGDLQQHIDLQASGVANQLIENFNRMSDRLNEMVTREAETKQFESFMRLSAMLTHDLKNAITGLSMLVSNMERQFHREEFRADAVLSLREATDKLRRIVARLSEPMKSLSGEYRRVARPTDLVPIIRRVLAANAEPCAPLYEIEEHLPENLVATIEPERVEAVVENLVINALEAMGAAGGRLTVEAGREPDGMVFISVADTGVGMTEEFIRTRLFHPFSTTKTKGIGLGLFTCREIVEAHGGRLNVESKVGAGTRFRVMLPSALFTSSETRVRQAWRTAS